MGLIAISMKVNASTKSVVDLLPSLYLPTITRVPTFNWDKSDKSRLKVGCFGRFVPLKINWCSVLPALGAQAAPLFRNFTSTAGAFILAAGILYKNLVNLFRNAQDDGELTAHLCGGWSMMLS